MGQTDKQINGRFSTKNIKFVVIIFQKISNLENNRNFSNDKVNKGSGYFRSKGNIWCYNVDIFSYSGSSGILGSYRKHNTA